MTRMAATLALAACAPDPYSWEYVTCATEIPGTIEAAKVFALTEIRTAGAGPEYLGEPGPPWGRTTAGRTGDPVVTLRVGWDTDPLASVLVLLHELVHVRQPPRGRVRRGDEYDREFPALRQELEALRALGYSAEEVDAWAVRRLEWWGWPEDVEILTEDRCDGDNHE